MTTDLIRLEVRQMLGQFDHVVDFPRGCEFTILYGPNGVGKTKLLELIAGTYALSEPEIARVPFESARFSFSDGTVIDLKNGTAAVELDDLDRGESINRITMTMRTKENRKGIVWKPLRIRQGGRRSVIELGHLIGASRVSPEDWVDPRTNERLSIRMLLDRYGHLFEDGDLETHAPAELQEFFSAQNVHMIRTQRLVTFDTERSVRTERERVAQHPTVVQFGLDLARRLKEALAANSLTTQRLDRTFPRRLLGDGASKRRRKTVVSEEQIRQKYEEQEELRARLASIAVLEESVDVPLPNRTLEDWERTVLWMYLQDTDERLATFQDLLGRVDLLRSIVNSRFQFKEMHIDPKQGFRFVTSRGKTVTAEDLSSGEQHELVLAYDLLFNVSPGSLVLIDEPEISLHVTWQQEFLNDLVNISRQSQLRFLVATHSPQIIHKWISRAQALTADYSLGEER